MAAPLRRTNFSSFSAPSQLMKLPFYKCGEQTRIAVGDVVIITLVKVVAGAKNGGEILTVESKF